MKYLDFDSNRKMDIVFLGRIAIDLNPIDYFHSLEECTTFRKYVGGSPANTSIGVSRHFLYREQLLANLPPERQR